MYSEERLVKSHNFPNSAMEGGFVGSISPDPHLTSVMVFHEFREIPMDASVARRELRTVRGRVGDWYLCQSS